MTRSQLQQALAGDRVGLTALVRELLPAITLEVTMTLRRRAQPLRRDARQDIDDFAHDALLHLLADGGRQLLLWDPDRGRSLLSFVRLLTRQRVSRVLQGHRGNPWADEPTEEGDMEGLTELDPQDRVIESREELRGLLERLRARLTPRGALLFQALFVEQRPIAEVAAELGMTREAVDAWNTRTRILARKLAADPKEPSR